MKRIKMQTIKKEKFLTLGTYALFIVSICTGSYIAQQMLSNQTNPASSCASAPEDIKVDFSLKNAIKNSTPIPLGYTAAANPNAILVSNDSDVTRYDLDSLIENQFSSMLSSSKSDISKQQALDTIKNYNISCVQIVRGNLFSGFDSRVTAVLKPKIK